MSEARTGFYGWLGNTLEHHSKWVIIVTLLVTLLLLYPLAMMSPTEQASDTPVGNEVVKLADDIEDTFDLEVLRIWFIVEARDGDMFTRKNLHELWEREQAIRESDLAEFLYTRYDEVAGTTTKGVEFTFADAINQALTLQSNGVADLSTELISDAQIKQIVDIILEDPNAKDLYETMSAEREYGKHGWISPALIVPVFADDEKVLQKYMSGDIKDASTEKKAKAREKFSREVQEIMRGDEEFNQSWGIAIDLELEIEDEGKISFMLLFVALILIAILLMVIFRSWLITGISIAGLLMLIIWLKGFANLIGLKGSVVLDLIVPITIVVLGVDYAIQALFRYRQQRDKGLLPAEALGSSTYRVGRALVLAMFTTIVAFGSNATSGIESVIGFAVAASFAMFASFVILGLFVPSVNMRWRMRRNPSTKQQSTSRKEMTSGGWLGRAVTAFSNRWYITLPIILIITAFAAWGWTGVETKFDAKDALEPDSDFVVSLDKWDEHGADKGGEPSFLYYEGDFTNQTAIDGMKLTIEEMDDNQHIGRDPVDGKPNVHALLLNILELSIENDYARGQIEAASNIVITDSDGDLIPDSPEQLQAVYDYVLANGLPEDDTTMRYNSKQIGELFVQLEPNRYATIITIGVPGTREQEIVKLASVELNEDLDNAMEGIYPETITRYGLTGSGDVRVEQFDAISESLSKSLIVAIVAVLLLLLVVFRSFRYAVVTIIPVLLVACWLYGFMYLAGYSLNMLTATIAAISIGVGIDFSIHFTERFREELAAGHGKMPALRITAETTGLALFSAAITTMVGFAVIAFAPMPMFSTFGILTAIMIVLSLFMALFVLPSLLQVFVPEPRKKE
ncbi:MAG: MMPL family transporter [Chloroflexi bacterium]|nr:MMPL family transporter [Chloroflexota bacterium]